MTIAGLDLFGYWQYVVARHVIMTVEKNGMRILKHEHFIPVLEV